MFCLPQLPPFSNSLLIPSLCKQWVLTLVKVERPCQNAPIQ